MVLDGRLIDGIRILQAVIDSGGFAKAADSLGMTQSGVSRSVARIESALGVRLIERTTRSVRVTNDGAKFLNDILPLLSEMNSVIFKTSQNTELVSGRLRINSDPLFCSSVLAPYIHRFLKMFPDVEVEIIATDRLEDFVANGYDIAIRFIEPFDDGLICRKLLDTRVITVASPLYVKKRGKPQIPEEIENYDCLHFRDANTGRPFEWEFQKGKKTITLKPKSQIVFSDPASLLNSCLAGAGIAQLLDFYSEKFVLKKKLVRLLPEWSEESFPLYALFPSRKHQPAKIKAFMGFIEPLIRQMNS